jgi:hypothetical protein
MMVGFHDSIIEVPEQGDSLVTYLEGYMEFEKIAVSEGIEMERNSE